MKDGKITGTAKKSRAVGIGCLIVFVLCAVLLTVMILIEPDRPDEAMAAVVPPTVALDTDILPVLRVDLVFDRPSSAPALIERIAEATRDVARNLQASPSEAKSLTAVDFTVKAKQPEGAPALQMHYMIKAPALLQAASDDRPAAFYLTLTSEAGPKSNEARTAIKAYCGATRIAFCIQSGD